MIKENIKENDLSLVDQAVEQVWDIYDDLTFRAQENLRKATNVVKSANDVTLSEDDIGILDDLADNLVSDGYEDYAEELWDAIRPLRQVNESKRRRVISKVSLAEARAYKRGLAAGRRAALRK